VVARRTTSMNGAGIGLAAALEAMWAAQIARIRRQRTVQTMSVPR
jgi:hypothetical protein